MDLNPKVLLEFFSFSLQWKASFQNFKLDITNGSAYLLCSNTEFVEILIIEFAEYW